MGRRRSLILGLRLALIGLLGFLAFPLLLDGASGVTAQTASSVTVPHTMSVHEPQKTDAFKIDTFYITLSGDPGANVSVSISFVQGGATGGSDCAAAGTDFDNSPPPSQILTAGSYSYTLLAFTLCADDNRAESQEDFRVILTADLGVFDSSASNCASATVCTVTVIILNESRTSPFAAYPCYGPEIDRDESLLYFPCKHAYNSAGTHYSEYDYGRPFGEVLVYEGAASAFYVYTGSMSGIEVTSSDPESISLHTRLKSLFTISSRLKQ